MDKQNFNQTGGFPLKTERLSDMQSSWSIFNQLGYIAGNLTIVQGCLVSGLNTGPGYVFINGELYPFDGGSTLSRVKIIEEKTAKEFENGDNKDVVSKFRVVFTNVVQDSILWASFTRIKDLKTLQAEVAAKAAATALNTAITRIEKLEKMTRVFVENGCIMPWGKAANTIPPGWSAYEPARGRMLVGRDEAIPDFDTIGETGGQKTKSLTKANLPANNPTTDAIKLTAANSSFGLKTGTDTWVHPALINGDGGTAQAIDIMNPYQIVEFIHYTG
ncbi:hypothetical protein [Flavobacterium cerinum]|uniref:Tail fiber protein n=1 Tax=Flavobacterium cerinum TaxID=2502784 RepID=A0A444HBQ7_9FLAO|nr:hypothetical protein [Flavobacterium cerinum]RWX00904.1 hypothetical protein EPI11_07740 [Flavobacterium cerinum]